MSSEMLLADKYLSIVNNKASLRSPESRGESKDSCPVWGAVGNTDYAVRRPPTPLVLGL
jgi:hypothetical protein